MARLALSLRIMSPRVRRRSITRQTWCYCGVRLFMVITQYATACFRWFWENTMRSFNILQPFFSKIVTSYGSPMCVCVRACVRVLDYEFEPQPIFWMVVFEFHRGVHVVLILPGVYLRNDSSLVTQNEIVFTYGTWVITNRRGNLYVYSR